MNDEVTEALRSAQELCAYLWNNTDANNQEAGNVELVAHSDEHAAQLAALLNDARTRIDAALHGRDMPVADAHAQALQAEGLDVLEPVAKFVGVA